MIITPDIYIDNMVEVHENVTIQVIIPADTKRDSSIAWTRDKELIDIWKKNAHVVSEGKDEQQH